VCCSLHRRFCRRWSRRLRDGQRLARRDHRTPTTQTRKALDDPAAIRRPLHHHRLSPDAAVLIPDMPGETAGRPLLPQTAQMQSFTFAPPTLAPRENQRSESASRNAPGNARLTTMCRLCLCGRTQPAQAIERCATASSRGPQVDIKALTCTVMRACEGCRRRKIKCDAATTNAWPCAACIRLKLNCVPPTVSYDKDWNATTQTFELEEKPLEYAAPDPEHEYRRASVMSAQHGHLQQMPPSLPPTPVTGTYADGMRMYQTASYVDQQPQEHMQYAPMAPPQVVQQNINYTPQQMYSEPPPSAPAMTMTPPATEGSWKHESASNLTDALGELKIDHDAIGKIRQAYPRSNTD